MNLMELAEEEQRKDSIIIVARRNADANISNHNIAFLWTFLVLLVVFQIQFYYQVFFVLNLPRSPLLYHEHEEDGMPEILRLPAAEVVDDEETPLRHPRMMTRQTECPRFCDCRGGNAEVQPPSREEVCGKLDGRLVFFAGDSLIRDTWSAAALWLLALDGFDYTEHLTDPKAICMAAAWRFIEPAGVIRRLKAEGFLTEELTAYKSVSTFKVCGGRTRLVFKYARLFSDLPVIYDDMMSAAAAAVENTNGIILIVSHGILEMFDNPTSTYEQRLRKWAQDLSSLHNGGGTAVVYLGTHKRITRLTPAEFMGAALTAQSNDAIRKIYTIVSSSAGEGLRIADAFNLTAAVDNRDTEDGLHFGMWVNLQRFWLALAAVF